MKLSSRPIVHTSRVVAGIMLLLGALMLSGCGPKQNDSSSSDSQVKASASAAVQQLQQDPKVQAAQDAAKAKVQTCLKSNPHLATKTGRQAFYACVVPPAEQDALKTCAQQAIIDGVMSGGDKKQQVIQDGVAACVVKVEGKA